MRRDSRIKFFRTDVNRGASWNFRRAVELATGEYFMYLAHDDKIDPVFLEKCVAVLDRQPEVMLVYPKAIEIDNQGQHLYQKEQDLAADSPQPQVRFRELIRMDHNCESFAAASSSSGAATCDCPRTRAICPRPSIAEVSWPTCSLSAAN